MDTRKVPRDIHCGTHATLVIDGIELDVLVPADFFSPKGKADQVPGLKRKPKAELVLEEGWVPAKAEQLMKLLGAIDGKTIELTRPECQFAEGSLQRTQGLGPRNRWGEL